MDRKYTVVCEWGDVEDNDHMDADEIQVRATSAALAISKAKKKWRLTIGAEWPSLRIEKVWIKTPANETKRINQLCGEIFMSPLSKKI